MSPADIVPFTAERQSGEKLPVVVEPRPEPPLSRPKLLEMILADSLLLEEAETLLLEFGRQRYERQRRRLARRMELQRERLDDAMAREANAQAVIASRPVLPTVEDAE